MAKVQHPQRSVVLLPNGGKCYHAKHSHNPCSKPEERRKQGWVWQTNRRTQCSIEAAEAGVQATEGEGGRSYVRSDPVVILDVGGQKFTALKSTLTRFPTTRYLSSLTLPLQYSLYLGLEV